MPISRTIAELAAALANLHPDHRDTFLRMVDSQDENDGLETLDEKSRGTP